MAGNFPQWWNLVSNPQQGGVPQGGFAPPPPQLAPQPMNWQNMPVLNLPPPQLLQIIGQQAVQADNPQAGDKGGKFGCVRCGGVVGGPAEYDSGHVLIKVYPGEYVLTERQAADAKKAGAKLPEWGFQKEALPKHISKNVKADRGGRNYARVHGRPPPIATPSSWMDYSRRYNEME